MNSKAAALTALTWSLIFVQSSIPNHLITFLYEGDPQRSHEDMDNRADGQLSVERMNLM
jgi:hypothetical protein